MTTTVPRDHAQAGQHSFDWTADSVWQFTLNERNLDTFIQPYVGNGRMGSRFNPLVLGSGDDKPLILLTRHIFDGGHQLTLPAWNHLDLKIGGTSFWVAAGTHRLTQTLDIRTGLVSLNDQWTYAAGKTVSIRIQMLVPRFGECESLYTLEIRGLTEPATIAFGLKGKHVAGSFDMAFSSSNQQLVGQYSSRKQHRDVVQAMRWQIEGLKQQGEMQAGDGEAAITMVSTGSACRLTVFHAIGSYANREGAKQHALARLDTLAGMPLNELFAQNEKEWKPLWRTALAYSDPDMQRVRMVLIHQFYLMCSLSDQVEPLGALGVSRSGWCGVNLWDSDLWIYRAALPLWPELARPLVEFRSSTLGAAQKHAADHGLKGAWFPWMPTEEGHSQTHPGYVQEIHNSVWIALGAWDYYLSSGDKGFLAKTGWPLIREIARFYASRGAMEADGKFHLRNVIGADEAVTEFGPGTSDDNFTTNLGARQVMLTAISAAAALGEKADAQWESVAENIYLPKADEAGIIPEHEGYSGAGIKQADLILSFYPLGLPLPAAQVIANIEYYRQKIMAYGPMMNGQIEACILMRLGEYERGKAHLFANIAKFVRGPHHVPFECMTGEGSVMLTGIGGTLQALIFGLYGYEPGSKPRFPRVGDSWQ